MSDAAASVTPKKASKPKVKKPAAHPKYSEMIQAAIGSLKERGGSSRQAILKYILKTYKVGDEKVVNAHLKMALRAGVVKKTLKQSKGTGASGSFRIGDEAKVTKPKVKKVKKPAAKKTPKKSAKPKAKKPAAKKSPKKAKKPAAKKAKKPAKKASPKKATKAKKPAKK